MAEIVGESCVLAQALGLLLCVDAQGEEDEEEGEEAPAAAAAPVTMHQKKQQKKANPNVYGGGAAATQAFAPGFVNGPCIPPALCSHSRLHRTPMGPLLNEQSSVTPQPQVRS